MTVTAKQSKAIAAFMDGAQVAEAAAAAGVSARQVARWLNRPDFQAGLREAERAALAGASRRLASLAGRACATLGKAISEDVPPGRVRAADILLARLVTVRQFAELEERLTALESALKQGGDK